MRTTRLIGAGLTMAALVIGGRAIAEDTTKKAAGPTATSGAHVMNGKDLTWGEVPPGLPAGATIAVLDGDPTKAGQFTVRLRMPNNYRIMPHTHPTAEAVTLIEGDFAMGHGARFDEKTMEKMKSGDFINLPTGHQHYAMCKSSCIVQVSAMGPFEINYVNPSDDPRKARASK